MNRIDRVSAILIQLQSKKWVTASEIAQRFGISLRTVYRDLKTLDEAGVPIGAEAGKGYFLVDGYRLPPVMFTREEAGALLMAEKMVEKFTDNSVNEHYQSAMFKIKSVLPDSEKQFVSDLNSNIEIFFNQQTDNPNNFISVIQKALVNKQLLNIQYRSTKNELTCRVIEPLGLCFYSISWHLIAFCRLRNEYRDFRVDRIESLDLNPGKFNPKEVITMKEYFSRYAESTDLIEVTLNFDNHVAQQIQNLKYYYGFTGQEKIDGKIQMDFLSNDLEYFGRWLLMFANGFDVIKPDALREIIKNNITALKNRFL